MLRRNMPRSRSLARKRKITASIEGKVENCDFMRTDASLLRAPIETIGLIDVTLSSESRRICEMRRNTLIDAKLFLVPLGLFLRHCLSPSFSTTGPVAGYS
jgi:hypothetical protein